MVNVRKHETTKNSKIEADVGELFKTGNNDQNQTRQAPWERPVMPVLRRLRQRAPDQSAYLKMFKK